MLTWDKSSSRNLRRQAKRYHVRTWNKMCLRRPKPIHAEQLLRSLDWPYLSHRLRAQKQGILLFILRASGTEQTLNKCLWDGCAKKGKQQASCWSASYHCICVIVPATCRALHFQLTSSLATINFLGSFTVVFGAPNVYMASLQRRLPLATKRASHLRNIGLGKKREGKSEASLLRGIICS